MLELFIIVVVIVIGLITFALVNGNVFHRPTSEEIGEYGENRVSQFLSTDPNSIVFNDIFLVDDKPKSPAKLTILLLE